MGFGIGNPLDALAEAFGKKKKPQATQLALTDAGYIGAQGENIYGSEEALQQFRAPTPITQTKKGYIGVRGGSDVIGSDKAKKQFLEKDLPKRVQEARKEDEDIKARAQQYIESLPISEEDKQKLRAIPINYLKESKQLLEADAKNIIEENTEDITSFEKRRAKTGVDEAVDKPVSALRKLKESGFTEGVMRTSGEAAKATGQVLEGVTAPGRFLQEKGEELGGAVADSALRAVGLGNLVEARKMREDAQNLIYETKKDLALSQLDQAFGVEGVPLSEALGEAQDLGANLQRMAGQTAPYLASSFVSPTAGLAARAEGAITGGGRGLIPRLVAAGAREAIEDLPVTAAQLLGESEQLVDKGELKPEEQIGWLAQRLPENLLMDVVAAGGLKGVGTGVVKGAEALARRGTKAQRGR